MPRRSFLLIPLLLAGCGGGSAEPPKTVPVTGSVVFKAKGNNLGGVKVTFHPQFKIGSINWLPSGTTDKAGKFVLNTGGPNNGAPPGEYKVTFELIVATADKYGRDTEVDVWKGKYADLNTAPTVTIGNSATTLDPFPLN
jgi:hypothetical protein